MAAAAAAPAAAAAAATAAQSAEGHALTVDQAVHIVRKVTLAT